MAHRTKSDTALTDWFLITEEDCVLYEVRTESLDVMEGKLNIQTVKQSCIKEGETPFLAKGLVEM
jgi:hypothetical protein